ncbi:ankyrin repeat domain-containing protein SOWAHA-like [Xiphophorus maculatus]|uniref:ankyrin repeat domain-containing protein SOWAHA-like n=1 Tax=Xiphophorus maculatus TaxID=8083 RepID=UPI0006D90767|nr:ankyrin repeat domain-containing protein SOWAHA-like [Xiphophorus maculatus]XP_027866772.1 ankyrin repeat domain-containing protein SOWAHA-like isoform X2 [Xiphophorus couchianus]
MMGDVTEESLLNYFFSAGGNSGRVKNADMLKTFKPFIGHSDPQLRAKYREEFKLIIDRIAVVKSENGEKYLVLKKKYRNLLQERDTRHHETDGNAQRNQSLARVTAAAQWEAMDILTSSPSKKEEQDEPMSCGEPDEEEQQAGTDSVHHFSHPPSAAHINDPSALNNGEDELDRDSTSKSESEHDEESTGSMGSASVALDPTEKEWIYHAASARVPDLSQLLMQEPSLANKKDFTSFTALHWAAKHGNENMAVLVADAGADVNTKSHGGYTPLHIAALHGHRHILDLLIGTYGAKENVRDYSGRLPGHYLNIKDPEGPQEDCDLQFQVAQARERNKNRKLVSLFHSKKKWGSAEELAPIEEERTASHQLALPPFRPRKFSR